MTKGGLKVPEDDAFTIQPAEDDSEAPTREEERIIEGQQRQEEAVAHVGQLDPAEQAKVGQFVNEEQQDKGKKDKKTLTAAQIRKRKKKAEMTEERKKRRLERLKRKQEKLTEVGKQLEKELNPEIDEKDDGIKKEPVEVKKEKEEQKGPGRNWTLSVAIPGSILDNAQSPELRLVWKLKDFIKILKPTTQKTNSKIKKIS